MNRRESRIITIDSLKYGASIMNLDIGPNPTYKALLEAIDTELARHLDYGVYACSNCGRDIIDGLSVCPFCRAEFKTISPIVLNTTEEDAQVVPSALSEVESELEGALVQSDNAEDEISDELEEFDDEDDWGELEPIDFGVSLAIPEDTVPTDIGLDDLDYEEIPKPKHESGSISEIPQQKAAPKRKSKTSEKARRTVKQMERDRKRQQILQELPYTKEQLNGFKRQALVMIASVVGVEKPISLGANTNIVAAILKKQKEG